MHRVILTATLAQHETLRETVLTREDIELVRAETTGRSIQELFMRPCPLWVVFDDPDLALPALLDELYRQYPSSNLSIIVLTANPSRFSKRGYIKLISSLQFDVNAVNEAIAMALNLPMRRGIRLPVRLGIKLGQEQRDSLVTTVMISSVGMLVETLDTLTAGSTYEFRFAGVKGTANLPAFSARVIRQEKGQETSSRVKFYSMEFLGVPKEKMEEILKMIVHSL